MSLISNFSNGNLSVSGKAMYIIDTIGEVKNNKVLQNVKNLPSLKNQNEYNIFHSGELVDIQNINGISYVVPTDLSASKLNIKAIALPTINSQVDIVNKTNNKIGYKIEKAGKTISFVVPNNDEVFYNTIEEVMFGDKITFDKDENNVVIIKKAVAGDKVYGYCNETQGIKANQAGWFVLDFVNVSVMTTED